ncbi:hypothetical protein FACS189428_6580 [Clostridia bacterium]|nr:hypothetical protein FACS189428_6580 [Clostridia bacterium]
MQHFSKQKQLHTDYGTRVMETGNHFKNGASLKSLTNRGNFKNRLFYLFVFWMFFSISMNAQKLEANSISTQILRVSTRHVIHVDLKPKAIEWSYAFTTNSKNKNLNLLSSVTASIKGVSFKLDIPEGSDNCKIYVTDKKNSEKFERKEDFFWLEDESFNESVSEGRKDVKREIEDYYLCIQNANWIQALDLSLEIVAVIKK